jgi:hypothetical protein
VVAIGHATTLQCDGHEIKPMRMARARIPPDLSQRRHEPFRTGKVARWDG